MAFWTETEEQKRLREQMMQAQMLNPQMNPQQPQVQGPPSPMVGGGTVLRPGGGAGEIKGQITGEQQTELDDIMRQDVPGMSTIMESDSPTLGTALAKIAAAAFVARKGKKGLEKTRAKREKVLQKDADKTEVKRVQDLADRQQEQRMAQEKQALYAKQVEAQVNPQMTEYQQAKLTADSKYNSERLAQQSAYYKYLEGKSGKGKGLTENQLALRTNTLEKKLAPIQAVTGAINDVDALLAPYMTGGSKEDETDIPGIGLIEGGRGTMGDLVRLMGSDVAPQIHSAMQNLTSQKLRDIAGSAQSLNETNNVLMSLAQTDLSDQDASVAAYMRLREAYGRDMVRLRNTTHPEVLARFEAAYVDNGQTSPLSQTFKEISFPGVGDFTEEIPGAKAQVRTEAELENIPMDQWSTAELERMATAGAPD